MNDRPRKPSDESPREVGKESAPDNRDHPDIQVKGIKTVSPVNLDGVPDIPGFRPEDLENLVELVRDPDGPLADVSLIKEADPDEAEVTQADLDAYITELAEKHNIPRDKITIRFQEDDDDDC
mgnify:FL=1